MNPHMPLPPCSVATTMGEATEVPASRKLAPQSITVLAELTLAAPLRPFRSAANLCRIMGVFLLLGVSLKAAPAIAQTPESAVEDWGSVLTTEAGLVVVPLHVYKNRKSVGGLGEPAFELVEDGVVQDIAFVDGPGGRGDPDEARTVPIEIILLVDVQHAMRIDLADPRIIRHRLFEGIKDNVAISVYGFADKLQRFLGPTRDIAKVQLALDVAYRSGDGHIPMLDAIVATARDAASRTRSASRKLVVFSGGLSREIFGEAAHSALDFEIPIYDVVLRHRPPTISRTLTSQWSVTPVLLGRPRLASKGAPQERPDNRNQKKRRVPIHKCCPLGMEVDRVRDEMGALAGSSGGLLELSRDLPAWKRKQSVMVRAYLKGLARFAQNEYFVGYYPSRKGDEPVARQVEVRLESKRTGQLFGGRRVIVY